jgi:hypothetical protein
LYEIEGAEDIHALEIRVVPVMVYSNEQQAKADSSALLRNDK